MVNVVAVWQDLMLIFLLVLSENVFRCPLEKEKAYEAFAW